MKALAILAGPRKGSATDMAIDAALKGAKDAGAEAEKVYLYDLDIKPCVGCYKCAKAGKCFIKDDHQALLDKMDACDALIFGAPTYWSNIPSEAKKFFDRSISFFEQSKMGPKRYKKNPSRVLIMTSCGIPWPLSHMMGIATGAMRAMNVFFSYMSARIYKLYITGMMDPDKSRPTQKMLDKAYRLGKKLAR